MIHRSARERLLDEAQRVGPDVTDLDGIRDHTASIVSSDTGPARLVRVMRGGSEVCWVFSLETGEERPQFYPSDLPFTHDLPDTATAVMSDVATFHEDQGWNVKAEGGEPPISIRTIWGLGARKRKLVSMSAAGVTIVELSEQVPEQAPA